jgi:hypothetical protein
MPTVAGEGSICFFLLSFEVAILLLVADFIWIS